MNARHFISARLVPWTLCAIAVCAIGFTLAARAQADEDPKPIAPEEYKGLTDALVKGPGKAEWNGVLVTTLLRQPRDTHSTLYGAIVGPIFRDPSRTQALEPEARRALFAHVIAHLVQTQPQDDVILLADAFLPALDGDPLLLQTVHDSLDKDPRTLRRAAWDRLLRRAVPLASDDEPVVRAAAIRVLAHRAPDDDTEGVAALFHALNAADEARARTDRAAYLDAFERLLHYRFESLAALQAFLAPFGERLAAHDTWDDLQRLKVGKALSDAVRDLYRAEGGTRIKAGLEQARRLGRQLVEKSTAPKDLEVFFDGAQQDAELQRLAVKAARDRMKPEANEAWTALLALCLTQSRDGQVLDVVLEVMGPVYLEPAPTLALAVAQRLEEGAKTDTIKQREDLAGMLGTIGNIRHVRRALPKSLLNANGGGNGADVQAPVYARLIGAVGRVKDGNVRELVSRYRTASGEYQPEWARQAVAEALGYKGIRDNPTQRELASLTLQHILSGVAVTLGEGDAATRVALPAAQADPSPAVRAAAIDSLQHYPGESAASVLESIASQETPEADTALKALGRQLRRESVDAARSLARLMEALPPEKRRLRLLELIRKEAPQTLAEPMRLALAGACRVVFEDDASSEAVRLEAGAALVHLAEPGPGGRTIELLYNAWTSATEPAVKGQWKARVGDLFKALAARGAIDAAYDRPVAQQIQTMAGEGLHADALAFLAALGEHGRRYPLKRSRAEVHYTYAMYVSASGGRSREARRADLDAALDLYSQLAAEAPTPGERLDVQRTLFNVLQERARADWLDAEAGEEAKTFLLRALDVAVQSENAGLATQAIESLVPQLEGMALSEPEKLTVAQHAKRLKELQSP